MGDVLFKVKHNRLLRLLLKPMMEISFKVKEIIYLKSGYPEKISQYKDMYKGKRCFVIGNGPSLRPEDLDLIRNEISFAANRIYNIYEKTQWRPTFFMGTDMDILRQEAGNIKKVNPLVMFLNYDASKYFGFNNPNINYLYLKGPFELIRNKFVQRGVSRDVSKYATKTQTVTCVSIELAMYMGFEKIYLLGVDHNFSKYVDSYGKMVEDKTVQNYFLGMKGGDSQAILYVDDTTACYKMVNKCAKDRGIRIYNATRGGKLEVFDRVTLEELF